MVPEHVPGWDPGNLGVGGTGLQLTTGGGERGCLTSRLEGREGGYCHEMGLKGLYWNWATPVN
jgi:hypothetical protein